MATRPTTPAINDWQSVQEPSDWQTVGATPTATIGPAEKPSWFDQAEQDFRQGGNRTAVGKVLGTMQGRGDKGFTGIDAGVKPAVADFMGSPELGTLQVAKGVSEVPSHPGKALGDVVGGTLKAATIPAMVAGAPAAESVAGALIPSTEKAAKMLADVAADANDVPVQFTRTWPALDEFMAYAKSGGTQPKVISDLLARMDDLQKGPITYEDARRFYSNISRLSDSELSTLNPQMRRLMGGVREAFKHDIGTAADQVDQAGKYYGAMKQYARAARLSEASKNMVDWAKKLVGTAALGAAGYEGFKHAGAISGALAPR